MSRFLRFAFSLCLMTSLLVPVRELVSSLPKWDDLFSASESEVLSPSHAAYRFESAIRQMLCDKFSLSPDDFTVTVLLSDNLIQPITLSLNNRKHAWLADDIKTYLEHELDCEVNVYVFQ